jgi:hypothetical protein
VSQAVSEFESQRPPLGQVAVVGLVSAGVLFLTVGVSAQIFNVAWGLWFSSVFVFLAVPFVVLQVSGRSPLRTTGLDQPAGRALAAGFALGVFNYLAWAVPLMWLAERLFPKEVVERYSSAKLFERQSTVEIVALVAAVSLAAPVCEEFLYRGLVQPGLAPRLSMPRSVVVTALLFSLMHFDPVGFMARFELGLVFGLLAWRGGSLWPAIGAHAANNIASVVIFLGSGSGEAEPSPLLVAGLFLGGNLALAAVLVWLRRSDGWVAPVPASDEPRPFAPFLQSLAPWTIAAVVALAGLAIADRRGVELNIIDALNPVKRPKADASAGERGAWDDLQALRERVRAGESGLDEYRALRQLAAEDRR